MILSSEALTNGRFHETRQGWKDVNRRANTLVLKLAVNENLAFGNVTSQVRNGVSDICNMSVKYSQEGEIN